MRTRKGLSAALLISALSMAAVAALLTSCKGEDVKEPVGVTGVSVSPSSLSLTEGGSETLTAAVSPSGADDKTVTWGSDKPGVASVDQTGKVTAVKAGSATITVTTKDGGKKATCAVAVSAKAIAVEGVALDKGELKLTAGESAVLTAAVKPEDATDKSVTWTSSDNAVATVDQSGNVMAVKEGSATITVTTKDGNHKALCAVTVNPESGTTKTVYVAGIEKLASKYVARLWTNGVATSLTDGTHDAWAEDVYVDGDDVYVAGYESNGSKDVAKIWKNGVASSLSDGSIWAYAHSVFVSGGDVYAVGSEYDGSKGAVKLWKNGVASSLTDGNNEAYALSVYVSGSDVYVAGCEQNGSNGSAKFAKLWKNGVAVSLTDGTHNAYANSVYVSGSDVYVAGEESNGTFWVAKLWKNGVETSLTDGTKSAGAESVFVSGSDVYVAGDVYDGEKWVATLWKNGVATSFADGSQLFSVCVSDGDVYVAGVGYNDDSKVWKNGMVTNLTDGTNRSTVYSMFVK